MKKTKPDIVVKDNKFAKKYKKELKQLQAESMIEVPKLRRKKRVNYGERLTRIAVWFALVSFVAMIAAQVYLSL